MDKNSSENNFIFLFNDNKIIYDYNCFLIVGH